MIYIIFGKSGTGKNTLFKSLVNDESLELTPIVTCTTRPPRDGETNEVDYYFISEEEFNDLKDNGKFLETTSYTLVNGDIWYYGTLLKDFEDVTKDKIIIVNPNGLKVILDECRKRKIPTNVILLHCTESKRLQRLLRRGDDKKEIARRKVADDKDFAGTRMYAHHRIDVTRNSEEQIYTKVKRIIERERGR